MDSWLQQQQQKSRALDKRVGYSCYLYMFLETQAGMVIAQADLIDCLEIIHTVDGHLLSFVVVQFFMSSSLHCDILCQQGIFLPGEPELHPVLVELWGPLDR